VLREQGYVIKQKRDRSHRIDVPYDVLLTEMQQANRTFPTLTLYDARAIGLFSIPECCDMQASVSSNSYIPERYPTNLVLRTTNCGSRCLTTSYEAICSAISPVPNGKARHGMSSKVLPSCPKIQTRSPPFSP